MCMVIFLSVIMIIRLISSSTVLFSGGLTCRPQAEVGLSVEAVTPESCSLWAVGTTLTCETTHTHTLRRHINNTHAR